MSCSRYVLVAHMYYIPGTGSRLASSMYSMIYGDSMYSEYIVIGHRSSKDEFGVRRTMSNAV